MFTSKKRRENSKCLLEPGSSSFSTGNKTPLYLIKDGSTSTASKIGLQLLWMSLTILKMSEDLMKNFAFILLGLLIVTTSFPAFSAQYFCDQVEARGVYLGNFLNSIGVDPDAGSLSGHYGEGDLGFELWSRDVRAVVQPIVYLRKDDCFESVERLKGLVFYSFSCKKSNSLFSSTMVFDQKTGSGYYKGQLKNDKSKPESFEFKFSNCLGSD